MKKLEKQKKEEVINSELLLIKYRKLLEENPDSTFYKGLVKNTEEYIKEGLFDKKL